MTLCWREQDSNHRFRGEGPDASCVGYATSAACLRSKTRSRSGAFTHSGPPRAEVKKCTPLKRRRYMAKTYFRIQSDFIEHRLPARNVGRASVPNETMEMRQSGRARLDS